MTALVHEHTTWHHCCGRRTCGADGVVGLRTMSSSLSQFCLLKQLWHSARRRSRAGREADQGARTAGAARRPTSTSVALLGGP